MVDYANLRSVADRLIKANGRQFTIRKFDRTTEAGKPWRNESPTTDPEWEVTVTGVFIEPSTFRRYGINLEDIEMIKRIATIALVPDTEFPSTIDPLEIDNYTDNGRDYRIEFIRPLGPGPVNVIWLLAGKQ